MTFHSTVSFNNLTISGSQVDANTTVSGKNVSFNKMTVANGSADNATITDTFYLTNGQFSQLITKNMQVNNETVIDDLLKSKNLNTVSIESSGLNITTDQFSTN